MRDSCQEKRGTSLLWVLLLGAGALALLRWPQASITAVQEGLSLCTTTIIPSLFPFFVLSMLMIQLGLSSCLGRMVQPVMGPLFRLHGACAAPVVLGLLGGYPVGAKTAISLYQEGQCTKREAEHLLSFCNNAGPALIVGVVGAGLLGSTGFGLLLYGIHVVSALCVGLIFRYYGASHTSARHSKPSVTIQAVHPALALTQAITGAVSSLLQICAFILFFSVILHLMKASGLFSLLSGLLSPILSYFGLSPLWIEAGISGILELSSGLSHLPPGPIPWTMAASAWILGWAGCSVHCQVLALAQNTGLSLKLYYWGKFLHGLLSSILTLWIVSHFPTSLSTFVSTHGELPRQSPLGSGLSLPITFGILLLLWGALLYFFIKCLIQCHKSPRYQTKRRFSGPCLSFKSKWNPNVPTAPKDVISRPKPSSVPDEG